MKMLRMLASIALASAAVTVPGIAQAQSTWPFTSGDFVEVAGIKVDDGHGLEYANHLATLWKSSSEFAKSQGWITDYEVLYNVHAREGEPDIYLITRFAAFADADEQEARFAAYSKHMAMTDKQMEAASAGRAEYRKQVGSMLLREAKFK